MNILLLPSNTTSTAIIDNPTIIHHLINILKVKVNDTIKVGITNGNLGTATIQRCSKHQITLSDIRCDTPPPPKLHLTVILAIPRPKVLRRLFLDMTAMGVSHIILVNSYRSEKSYWQTPFLQQIDDYIKEGLQQSCDTVAPIVELRQRLKPFVEDELPTIIQHQQAIIAHPYATKRLADIWQHDMPHVLIIGAEGGWIDYEVELFIKAGCQAATMGERILRTENAVNVLCGFCLLN